MNMKMRCYCVAEYKQPLLRMDIPVPVPTGDQVLVKVQAAGVCHSDLHIWEGGYDLGNGRMLSLKERGATLPQVLGHETAGVAVAAGESAAGIELGKSYLVYPWIGCGQCPVCLAGDENLCAASKPLGVLTPGGYAEYILVPKAKYLLPLGDVDPVAAAPYACSGVTTYSALKKIGPSLRDVPIVIFGAGGLGLMCISIANARGAKGVVAVEIDPQKRQAALAAGAKAAIDGKAPDAAAQILAAVGRAPLGAIDFVGAPQTSEMGFNLLAKGGKLVMVGLFGGVSTFSLALIAVRGVSVVGSLVGNLQDLTELMALVRAGKVPRIPITRQPLDKANDTLMALHDGKVVGRSVLVP
jgi:propanol-preferring alcohol dehydrogenase